MCFQKVFAPYVVVTGGPHKDVGKGTLAAMFGRYLCVSKGLRVNYQKIDPCVQPSLEEIARQKMLASFTINDTEVGLLDDDLERAWFWIPSFTPAQGSGVGMKDVLERLLSDAHAEVRPSCLGVPLQSLLSSALDPARFDLVVVEVGGTAGEPEHGRMLQGLRQAFGPPAFHLHLAAMVTTLDGTLTSKPAQLALDHVSPDVVVVRGAGGAGRDTLGQHFSLAAGRVLPVDENSFLPEVEYAKVIAACDAIFCARLPQLREGVAEDPLLRDLQARPTLPIERNAVLVGNAANARRVAVWSRGQLHGCIAPSGECRCEGTAEAPRGHVMVDLDHRRASAAHHTIRFYAPDGEWGFLSNFFSHPVQWNGKTHASSEHAYQSVKFTCQPDIRAAVEACPSPAEAFRLSREHQGAVDADWPSRRLSVMSQVLHAKFSDAGLRALLAGTAGRPLVEVSTAGDAFWGVRAADGLGQNMLGLLLMALRDDLAHPPVPVRAPVPSALAPRHPAPLVSLWDGGYYVWQVGCVDGPAGCLVRVHDACFTSELFNSLKCECKAQLDAAQKAILRAGCGVVIHTPQEGRGVGAADKLRAYHVQERLGLDTVDANRCLGLPDDTREYGASARILRQLGVRSVRLLTGSPRKVAALQACGLEVSMSPLVVCRAHPLFQDAYLTAKQTEFGHRVQ